MNDFKASYASWRIGRVAAALGLVAVVVSVASCGGSNNDNGSQPAPVAVVSNTPPASASSSVDGFIAFMKVLVATQQDTADPLDVTTFVAPTTDTGDPDPSVM